MLRGGDLDDGGDRALEHQARPGADDEITDEEHTEARGRQPDRDREQAEPGEQCQDRRG